MSLPPPSFARHVGFAVVSILVSLVILAAILTVLTLSAASAPDGGTALNAVSAGVFLFVIHLRQFLYPGVIGWLPILVVMIVPGYWIFRALFRALAARGRVIANLVPAVVVALIGSLFHGVLLAFVLGDEGALPPNLMTSLYTVAGAAIAAFLVLIRRAPA